MSSYKYLDTTGLSALWAKIKGIIPTKTSDLANDSGFIDACTFYVTITGNSTDGYVADKTFDQVLAAYESGLSVNLINANYIYRLASKISSSLLIFTTWPATNSIRLCSWNKTSGSISISSKAVPSNTSDLTNDSGFVTTSDLSAVATTGAYSDLSGTPSLATVATSGSYSDLSNKPTITTYTISISGNVITLTGSDSSTSTATLPVYNGGVSS